VDEIVRGNPEIKVVLPILAPGLVDLQVNGYHGVDFNDPVLTPALVRKVSRELLSLGVCKYFPTLITGPKERISASLKCLSVIA
jgi:N-acetylglucosamine-6-phosphate deacetylase